MLSATKHLTRPQRPAPTPCVILYKQGQRTVVDFRLGGGRVSGHALVVKTFLHADEDLLDRPVLNRITLRAALERPEEFPDLIIQIGGYPYAEALANDNILH